MKKILFILPSLTVGGMERVQVTLANALARAGYHVTVMTFDEGEDLAPELDLNVRFIHRLPKYRFLKKIPKIRYYFDDGLWETRASAKTLHGYYVGKEKFDVEIGFFRGRSIKIVSGGKSTAHRIAWVHNDFRHVGGVKANFQSMGDVKQAYRCFDHVICVSHEAQKGFIETLGDTGNLTTIYNLLPVEEIVKKSLEAPEKTVPKASLHCVLVGRLQDSAKGQCRLVRAVSKLHDEGLDISLALVGGGADREKIVEEIKDARADHYITMTGNQKNPYPYIKEADLLVCASYYEGYNLTVAEALIMGTPVLSTKCTGPTEILDGGKYGMLVENSEEGLYQGLKSLLGDRELLDSYREKAALRKPFFSEDAILSQITRLFEE